MQGKYSLTEAANKIGATSAWINRVQRETGIGGVIGKKGQKVSFDYDTVETLRRVKILRLLNFSFEDIKELYGLEKGIISTEEALSHDYELSNISGYNVPLIIHLKEVAAIGPLFVKDADNGAYQLLSKDNLIETYVGYMKRVYAVAQDIIKRKGPFLNTVEESKALLKILAERYPPQSA